MPSPTEFGRLLRYRREAAKLTRANLGTMAGLSECFIKFVETGWRQSLSTASAHRLLSVPQLALTWEDFDSITLTPLGSRPLPQKPSAEVILLAALEVVRSHYPLKS
jgi:transcriptional regulator with XRE-family HTH domain